MGFYDPLLGLELCTGGFGFNQCYFLADWLGVLH